MPKKSNCILAFAGQRQTTQRKDLVIAPLFSVATQNSEHVRTQNFTKKEYGLAIGLYMTGINIGPAIATPLAAAPG